MRVLCAGLLGLSAGMWAGCTDPITKVEMSGVVWDGPEASSPVGGATLEVRDDQGAVFANAVAGADGAYAVNVPAGAGFLLYVGAEGYTSTGWAGSAGLEDFSGGDTAPWIASSAWMDELRASWAGCPAVDAAGAVVIGELRLGYPGLVDGIAGQGATAEVLDEQGVSWPACYRDADGLVAPDATEAGPDGSFVVFGVPAGVSWLVAKFVDDAETVWETDYLSPAPADGLVPLFPVMIQIEDT